LKFEILEFEISGIIWPRTLTAKSQWLTANGCWQLATDNWQLTATDNW